MPQLALVLVLVLLQIAAPPRIDPLLADVGRLTAATDNDQRFEALAAMLRARALPFTVEPFTLDKPVGREPRTRGRNIVLALGEGADGIVLGAHYDAARLDDGSLSRGAIDNGGSSVMLVHLAEAMRAQRLAARVTIVWFDMEELGLLGSTRYLRAHGTAGLRAMVNFDINAHGDTVLFSAPPPDASPLRRVVLETCAAESVDCVRFPQLPASDDVAFARAGVPTVSVARLPAAEAHHLWLILNPAAGAVATPASAPPILQTIHTAADVLDKVDGASLAGAQRFALALTRRLAEAR